MKNQLKTYVVIALLSSGITLGAFQLFELGASNTLGEVPSAFTNSVSNISVAAGNPGEFTYAAEKTTPAVVHITTKMQQKSRQQFSSPFDDLFGGFGDPNGGGGRRQAPQQQEASGSGVIISADGYIVTNNHVVAEATEISVVLNDKREFKAKVISTDPSSDLAVIQIKASGLPFLTFGDSDALRVGEWVLAVGNPFNLESTVTAGIVSAKGRQNIIDREGDINPLESFIQTDAAVNPGNSGGALVNLKGELIGINTAIYSRTGQFAGYSFAVPVSIVKKVSGDLIKYGNVQRGFLGVSIIEVNSKLVDEKDLKIKDGVYVGGFSENSAAKDAGIKINDVIIKIDGVDTKSTSKLMEIVGSKRPGEALNVSVNRDGQLKEFKVMLKNKDGNTSILKGDDSETYKSDFLGAKFGTLSNADKEKFKVSSGVKVVDVTPDGRLEMYGLSKGSIITKINDKNVNNPKEATEQLEARKGRIKLEGIDADGSRFIYVL